MEFFLNVLLPIPLERLFTYRVSESEASVLKQGMRVAVPFGKSKIYTGLAMELHHNPPAAYEPKPIHQILDEHPLVSPIQLQHWTWIADYYMCTLGEVFRTAVPSAFLLESETVVLLNRNSVEDENSLNDDEFQVHEALSNRGALKVKDISDILEKKTVLPVLNSLVARNAIVLKEELVEQYKPKMLRYVSMADEFKEESKLEGLLDDLSRAPKQIQAVLSLFQLQAQSKDPVLLSQLYKVSRVSPAVVRSLLDKGILEEYSLQADRIQFARSDSDTKSIHLNEEQSIAIEKIRACFQNNKVTLLHGVTSSGKTEIYVKLIAQFIKQNKQVLYLLPEIALTTQLIGRLQAYFGEHIAVYHSRYNLQERVEVWKHVMGQTNKARIVLGARSALFLPFSELGLVIVDEEHETSYKQFDPAPRYHARDAAIMLARMHSARVLLGSATPSIESYHNTSAGKYGYAELKRRYGNVLLPEIELVDLKKLARQKRLKGHFSEKLIELIQETLDLKEQVILFQNRRGYAPILECISCGHAPGCPNCDVSLTYHRFRDQLRCHYCGYHTEAQSTCEACGNQTLEAKGLGTQQVEDEVKELFPQARVGRMDFDTTRGKYAYGKIITAFEQQEIDILVGTQMLTKGLDFRHVNLVGIMNADTLLNFPDFRAHERSFQMLTQVAGRAGRTEKRGRVIIQTYNPYHQILQQVTSGDYDTMYREQLYEREQFHYPPHNRIIRITFKHRNYNQLNEAADWFTRSLRNEWGSWILGPEFAPIPRIRNQYLKNVLVKIPRDTPLTKMKKGIKRIEKSFNAISQYKAVRVIYDVDHM